MAVRLAGSPGAEAALIADYLRRAHLVAGVPWSQMAVIVRSVPRAAAGLSAALARAGVPVAARAVSGSLAEQPAAQALLTVLAATATGLDGKHALSLLTGPIGRVDPVSLRQLRRALRRGEKGEPPREFADLLVEALSGKSPARLTPTQARPLQRVRAVLAAAARCHGRGGDPRYTLWEAWHRSGLQRRWLTACERGGTSGRSGRPGPRCGDRAVRRRRPVCVPHAGASLPGLIDHVSALQLPQPARESTAGTEQVAVLSAHAALGREWDLVVIAGLQEGLWPNTIPRGGVLGTQRLLDVLDGVDRERVDAGAAARRGTPAAHRRDGPGPRAGCWSPPSTARPATTATLPSPFFAELAHGPPMPSAGRARSNRSPRRGCCRPPRWWAGCAAVVCAPEGAVERRVA